MQTFREVREQGCYYVDKTGYARRLLDEGKHYFLSRPRRFGKSLFLDTLKELFEGNESLFEGLAVRNGWDWSVRHPVLRLDSAAGLARDRTICGWSWQRNWKLWSTRRAWTFPRSPEPTATC